MSLMVSMLPAPLAVIRNVGRSLYACEYSIEYSFYLRYGQMPSDTDKYGHELRDGVATGAAAASFGSSQDYSAHFLSRTWFDERRRILDVTLV